MSVSLNGIRRIGLVLSAFTCVFSTSCSTKETSEEEQPVRPNIMVILADDMGFSDIGAYGGEVQTPNIDGLAETGLRYTQFYNNARCCPTRASLITGLYPHQAGMGWMTAADLGRPAYQGELNNSSVTLAEVLNGAGYETYMTGKWHLSRVRNVKAKIKTNWPMQRGFEHYFGIIDGAANYFTPELCSGNTSYQAPDSNFYLTHAISDTTVQFIDDYAKSQNSDPFFMYVAYTSPHWPLHALENDIKKYREVYKEGWDNLRLNRLKRQKELGIFDDQVELSERDPDVPAWEDLSKEQQHDFVQRMAIYAAQIDAMDQGIGRIVEKLKETGQLDNTVIFFLSDNGACAEFIDGGQSKDLDGQSDTFQSYRINWANASSTPYREYKHWIHEGGIATPFIVHWPDGVDPSLNGSMVREPGHITDIMATCVDLAHADYPESFNGDSIHPMEGQSLKAQFSGDSIHHHPIFWEHEANIGVRDGQWKMVAKTPEDADFDSSTLELYDMIADPSELHDLSERDPQRLQEMYAMWKKWAEKVEVFPMDTRNYGRRGREYQRQVNGDFNEGLAGWQIPEEHSGEVSLDSTGQITGALSARLNSAGAGAGSYLSWPFFAAKGEKFDIVFKVKGKGSIKVHFEGPDGEPSAEKEYKVSTAPQEFSLTTPVTPKNGQYHFAFEVTDDNSVALWIDDVRLEPLE